MTEAALDVVHGVRRRVVGTRSDRLTLDVEPDRLHRNDVVLGCVGVGDVVDVVRDPHDVRVRRCVVNHVQQRP